MKNTTVGIHYETPSGKIAYTYGLNNATKMITYRFDDNEGSREVSYEEFDTWKPRRDLKDFPNASDPRLPYVFDLYWDIKFMSQLKQELEWHEDENEIREAMAKHNIVL